MSLKLERNGWDWIMSNPFRQSTLSLPAGGLVSAPQVECCLASGPVGWSAGRRPGSPCFDRTAVEGFSEAGKAEAFSGATGESEQKLPGQRSKAWASGNWCSSAHLGSPLAAHQAMWMLLSTARRCTTWQWWQQYFQLFYAWRASLQQIRHNTETVHKCWNFSRTGHLSFSLVQTLAMMASLECQHLGSALWLAGY